MRTSHLAAWMLAAMAGAAMAQQTPTTQPTQPRPTQPSTTPGTQPSTTQPSTTQPGRDWNQPGMRDQNQPGAMGGPVSAAQVQQIISSWPAKQQEAYRSVSAKFGQPDEVSASHLIWRDKENFKKIVLMKNSVQHLFPAPHEDFLEACVNYKVPPDKVDDLAKFNGSVVVHRTFGTLSATCDTLEHDIIALNLAHDIVTDKKTVEEARTDLAKQVMAAKQTPGAPGSEMAVTLQFRPDLAAADPDQPARTMATPESPMRDNDQMKDKDKDRDLNNPERRPGEIPKQNPETPR